MGTALVNQKSGNERKGILTPDQEKTLDKIIVINNKLGESVDGLAISLIDNQVIEQLKSALESKYPGATETYVYPIIDALFVGIDAITEEK